VRKLVAVLVLTVMAGASPAIAHARLVGSAPQAGSRTAHVDKVLLNFSEKLEPAFSGAQLVDDTEKPMTAPAAISGASITLTAPGLKPGHYRVHWHSVGDDTHRMEGSFQFTVLP
jgi:methionine-rich copper-binding protein CopC